jgi:hypothetical protein
MAEANRKEYYNSQFRMTHCPLASGEENVDILLDYCNRKLDPALVEIFEKHMEVCNACRAFAESQMAVWDALDAFEAMPVSADFDRKLMARIEREESSLWRRVSGGSGGGCPGSGGGIMDAPGGAPARRPGDPGREPDRHRTGRDGAGGHGNVAAVNSRRACGPAEDVEDAPWFLDG